MNELIARPSCSPSSTSSQVQFSAPSPTTVRYKDHMLAERIKPCPVFTEERR